MDDAFYMRRALQLAKRGWGSTNPNPMVGAVIVENSEIVAEGYHEKDGQLHAERNALKNLGRKPKKGATMYVTLEPCSTAGRTGACTDAIIAAGISKVVIGAFDPNPAHAARAVGILKNAGIDVVCGVLKEECENLNFIFNHYITKNQAFVLAKFAVSKNLKLTEKAGVQSHISCGEANANTMRLRKLFSAIGVGFNTYISDNPRLTARIDGKEYCGKRLLFDYSLNCVDNLKGNLFTDKFAENTHVVCGENSPIERQKFLAAKGVNLLKIESKKNSPDFWKELKTHLAELRISSLMIEGGSKILTSLFSAGAADAFCVYQSPNLLSESGLDALPENLWQNIKNVSPQKIGCDTMYTNLKI